MSQAAITYVSTAQFDRLVHDLGRPLINPRLHTAARAANLRLWRHLTRSHGR